jgi:hypothetical protein
MNLLSKDPIDDNVEFYINAMAERGWSRLKDLSFPDSDQLKILRFFKGGRSCTISLWEFSRGQGEQDKKGGGVAITINMMED